jgi:ACS family hexuronate transporter-like MFS transporter
VLGGGVGHTEQVKHSYRWVILSITTVAQTTVSMLNQGIAPLAPFIQTEYALSRAQVGLLNLALGLGSYLTVAISGRLIDRLGERLMMLASGVIAGVLAATILASHGFLSTEVLIVLMGAGVAISTPAGSKAVMGWFDVRIRGTAMGIRQVGIPMGGMVSSLLLPPLALVMGWRGALTVAGGLAIAGSAMCWTFYRDPPAATPPRSGLPPVVSFRSILRNRDLWLISLYSIAMISAQFTFSLYLVVFATERLGQSVVAAGTLLALAQGVAVGARIAWGIVSDRVFGGDRRPAMAIIALLAGCSSIGFSFLHFGVPLWLVALAVIVLGASAIGWNGLYVTAISEVAGQASAGTALGLSLSVSQLGVLVVPPLFGLLADHTGSYQPAWIALGVFVLIGTLPIYRVGRHA